MCVCAELGEDKTTDEGDVPIVLTTITSGDIKDLQDETAVAPPAADDPEKKDELLEGRQQRGWMYLQRNEHEMPAATLHRYCNSRVPTGPGILEKSWNLK